MRDMKDSGIEWIGKIPEKWEVYRFKDISSLYTGNSIKDELKQFFEDSNDAKPYIASKDVNLIYNEINYENGIYVKNNDRRFRIAPKNATLMCIEGGSAGKKKALLSKDVCFVNKLCCFNPTTKIDKDFLFYFLNNPSYEDEFKLNISGLIGGVSVSKLKNLKLCLPPLQKQIMISAYLNRKCSEINALRLEIEKEIATLKEYKKSIITEAVTKGLNKNVPMKDSGIEWIGHFPTSWGKSKLLYYLKTHITDGPHETPTIIDDGIPFISVDNLNDSKHIDFNNVKKYISEDDYRKYMLKAKIENGSILFSKAASIGKTAIVGNEKFMVWSPLAIIKPNNNILNRNYLYYLLNCDQLIKTIQLSGSYNTQANVGMREIERAIIPIPTISNQQQIADYLDRKCSKIDDIIEAKNKQIAVLNEYKKSLIYEYVTGKKEVPNNE